MRIIAAIQGDLRAYLDGEATKLSQGIRRAVNDAAMGLRDELRGQVRAARLGTGIEKAWRAEVYPKNPRSRSLRPAGLVWSKATVLHQAYLDGATIVAGKSWLVIATPEGISLGFGYTSDLPRGSRGIPAGAKRKYSQLGKAIAKLGAENIRIVDAKGGNKLVLYTPPGRRRTFGVRGRRFSRVGKGAIPIFILTRQVTVRRVLDFDGPAQRWFDRMYRDIAGLG